MKRRQLLIGLMAAWATAIVCLEPAWARKASVGANLSQSLYVGDSALSGDISQLELSVFISYFLSPKFALVGAFETDIESSNDDPNDRSVAVGLAYFPWPLTTLSPFFKTDALILLDPDQAVGFRSGVGLHVSTFPIFGVDGFYVTYQTAIKGIFEKTGGPFYGFEFFRLGFDYVF